MNEVVVKKPRRVIPRWRDFATTAAMGELGSLRPGAAPETLPADLSQAKQNWAAFKSPLSAGELLTAALVEKDWAALSEAATFLCQDDVVAPEFTKEIARHAMEWAVTENPFPAPQESATQAPIFNPSIIGSIRRTLANFPYSAIHWVELALGYSIIGRPGKARRSMVTALRLAPNDRFVLRCATRFFLHQDQPEMALDVLNASPRTGSDAWLLSAHLSVATILEKSSKLHKQARNIFDSKSIAPFHLSELGSALATTELVDGNDRKARKLFKAALVDPTENTLAQALWARDHIIIEQQEKLLNLPRSFEANARFLVQAEKWDQAVIATESWLNDEPFSGRPAILGSFLAGAAQEDFPKAERIARMGLTANANEPTLINNLAFAQACSGNPQTAICTLSHFPRNDLTPEQETALIATDGLIEYRSGNPEGGRAKYREAIEFARQHKLPSHLLRATIHYAREELRANTETAHEAVREAADLARKSADPNVRLVLSKLNEDLKRADLPSIEVKPEIHRLHRTM